jgi:predicted O-methyltransferase YrrM
MKHQGNIFKNTLLVIMLLVINIVAGYTQNQKESSELDNKVKAFLDKNANKWTDMNIPATDGKLLFDLIILNNYKNAVEIGTSSGHSAIWMAWALSKTGGKLITIEIDEIRYKKALANFKEAGLSDYIDARLGDAHKIIPELNGTYDFVFCDADKNWYRNYFISLSPKIKVKGCFVAHNVGNYGRTRPSIRGGTTRDFFEYVSNLTNYITSVNNQGEGMSISYKKAEDPKL